MENSMQDPTLVPDHASGVSDELLVDVVLVKRGEDLVSKQAAISRAMFQQSPKSAASKILSGIKTKFVPKEQRSVERAIRTHFRVVKTNNLNQIYVYIVITGATTDDDGDETVTACTPMIFLHKPCDTMNDQFKTFSGHLISRIEDIGGTFKLSLRKVHEAIHKYGDSILYEEIEEESKSGQDCSICMNDYTVGSRAIRLPCDHMFCTRCILLWLLRNGSCPLCRYQLVLKSPALEQRSSLRI